MKILTKEDEKAHYDSVVRAGFKGGAIGLAGGLAGAWLAYRRFPAFRGLTLPFRAFLLSSVATAGSIVAADHASIAFSRERDPTANFRGETQRARDTLRAHETTSSRLMEWGRRNRYSIVFGSWIASMAVAFAIVSRQPMSAAQKLVQARVYAQGLTVAVLVVTAVFEMSDAKKGEGRWETVMVVDPDDPEHKKLIEKKIHREDYQGQDLWKDMVAAEERRIQERKRAAAQGVPQNE
ncbi:hypothetical protein SODALDRAFT_273779 [Sodiomyces alkalinus F11]|uniref:HIG1 domain-containing protein n=1 Tax=Sodiomyces alkalinus (strain CBS 110278 / VKM F-3762 / F11) TaxID=1314773 RepID=A0A3N2PYS8_SODAK|nr:hypothetical protein SODALDRAFT_273779 [Sodiomyces alkalinus F11]ROT39679.1 hypothetical protein SODALDRAFT_273779 [Sodiomyces alkalinus F11]